MFPDARTLAEQLVGQTLVTLDRRKPNHVLAVTGPKVIVATEASPGGKGVSLRRLQQGLDILARDGAVRITPETFDGDRRSSFIGAALATLPGVVVETDPLFVRQPEPGETEIRVDQVLANSYPDPEHASEVDAAGVRVALAAIRERFEGFAVRLMPHNNPGYDVEVTDADGVAVGYVEIKSTSLAIPAFFLSEPERRFAIAQADRYHLLVVSDVNAAAGAGTVQWHDGPLAPPAVSLTPRQWKGVLRAGI